MKALENRSQILKQLIFGISALLSAAGISTSGIFSTVFLLSFILLIGTVAGVFLYTAERSLKRYLRENGAGFVFATIYILAFCSRLEGIKESLRYPLVIFSIPLFLAAGKILIGGRFSFWGMGIYIFQSIPVFQTEAVRESVDRFFLLAVILLVYFLIERRNRDYLKEFSYSGRNFWLLSFLLPLFLSVCFSVYPYASFDAVNRIAFDILFFLFLTIEFRREEYFRGIMGFIVVSIAMIAFSGLFAAVRRILFLGWSEGISIRIWTLDIPPNYAAFYIIMAIPFVYYLYFTETGRLKRISTAATSAASALFILITYSRAAWLAFLFESLVIIPAFYIFKMKRSRLKTRLIATGIILPALLVIIWVMLGQSANFQNRVKAIADIENDPRVEIWKTSFEMFLDNPVSGTGPGMKRYLHPLYHGEENPYELITGQYLLDCHNTYLEILSSSGIPGLAGFLLLTASFIFSQKPKNKTGKNPVLFPDRRLRFCALTSLTVFCFDALVNYRLLLPDNGWLFWFTGAVLWSGKITLTRKRKFHQFIACFLALLVSLLIVGRMLSAHSTSCMRKGLGFISKIGESKDLSYAEAALESFKRAAVIFPFNAHPFYLMGVHHKTFGDPGEATEYMEKAVSMNPVSADYHERLGLLLLSQNKYQEAEKRLLKAVSLKPYVRDNHYRLRLAELYLSRNRKEEAEFQFLEMLKTDPDSVPQLLNYMSRRSLENLLLELKKNVDDQYDHHHSARLMLMMRTAQAMRRLNMNDQARIVYETELSHNPYHLMLRIRASRLFTDQSMFKNSESLLKKAEMMNNLNGIYYNETGIVKYELAKYEEAQNLLLKAIKHWPSITLDNHLAHVFLLKTALKTENDVLAGQELEKLKYLAALWEHQMWEARFHFADMYGESEQHAFYRKQIEAAYKKIREAEKNNRLSLP